MLMSLQQPDVRNETTVSMAAVTDHMVPLNVNLPGLLIIPTLNGVVLIA